MQSTESPRFSTKFKIAILLLLMVFAIGMFVIPYAVYQIFPNSQEPVEIHLGSIDMPLLGTEFRLKFVSIDDTLFRAELWIILPNGEKEKVDECEIEGDGSTFGIGPWPSDDSLMYWEFFLGDKPNQKGLIGIPKSRDSSEESFIECNQ